MTLLAKPRPRPLTTREAAALLGVSRTTVRELALAKALRAVNLGRPGRRLALRFERDDLEAFLRERETKQKVRAADAVDAVRGPRPGGGAILLVDVGEMNGDKFEIALDARALLKVTTFRAGRGREMTCPSPNAPARLAKALRAEGVGD